MTQRKLSNAEYAKIREEILTRVSEEIDLHRLSKISRFTTTPELIEKYNISKSQVMKALGLLEKEDRIYRGDKIMSQVSKRTWENPEHRERAKDRMRERWENPLYKGMMVQVARELWEDPNYRKMMEEKSRERAQTPENREKVSQQSKNLWEDPKHRKLMKESLLKRWEDPKFKKMMSRLGRLNRIEDIKRKNGKASPNYNQNACEIIELYGILNGYNFIHAETPSKKEVKTELIIRGENGECHIPELGYWVDGYDPEKNIVIEFYEKAHNKRKEKDEQRQKEITEHLGCEFIILKEGSNLVNNLEALLVP